MVVSFANHEHPEVAFELFAEMEMKSIEPDEVCFVSVLKACGNLGAKEELNWSNKHIMFWEPMTQEPDLVSLRSSLGMPIRDDVVTWTSMLSAYVQQGSDEESLELLEKMV
ncbi:hypothetical protein GOP47_0009303 [Adiantum capillus-veneris]|uniref:Pentatricopeptide repeat-containing protein n=1 Tax=Adiantum capillus-veneris TaxID=13818 RepID=A0A9D4UWU5_ADICA|nr:hypothetical protein GOP47_0009303 [Adiantum capillus-veneris]